MSFKVFYTSLSVLSLLVILSFNSCYYDNEQYLYGGGSCDTTVAATYTGRIKAIMDTRCASTSCHGGPSPANGVDLTNYTNVRQGIEALDMMCNIKQESSCVPMPKNEGPISACDILALEKWQANGFPEN